MFDKAGVNVHLNMPPELVNWLHELKAGLPQGLWANGAVTGGLVVAVAVLAVWAIVRELKR